MLNCVQLETRGFGRSSYQPDQFQAIPESVWQAISVTLVV